MLFRSEFAVVRGRDESGSGAGDLISGLSPGSLEIKAVYAGGEKNYRLEILAPAVPDEPGTDTNEDEHAEDP